MSAVETARTTYDSARAEILKRIGLRDNIILLYLAAIAAVFGLAYGGQKPQEEILLLLPYLGLGATAMISQHDTIIAHLCTYIANELAGPMGVKDGEVPCWENSASLKRYALSSGTSVRIAGQILLVVMPSGVALALTFQDAAQSQIINALWALGCVVTLGSLAVMVFCFLGRRTHYHHTEWRRGDGGGEPAKE